MIESPHHHDPRGAGSRVTPANHQPRHARTRSDAETSVATTSTVLGQEEGVTIHVDRAVPDASDFGTWTIRAEQ